MNYEQIGLLVALVLAICFAVKQAKLLKSRWIPLLAIVLGAIGSVVFMNHISLLTIMSGVIVGLSTAGFYDLNKKTILGK